MVACIRYAFCELRIVLIFDTDNPLGNAKEYTPFHVFLVGFTISLVTLFKSLKHLNIDLSTTQSFINTVMFGCLTAFIGRLAIRDIKENLSANREFSFAIIEKVDFWENKNAVVVKKKLWKHSEDVFELSSARSVQKRL